MASQQELLLKIKEIEKQLAALGAAGKGLEPAVKALKLASNNSADLSLNLSKADNILGLISDKIDLINSDLDYTFSSFQGIVRELSKQESSLSKIKKSTSGLTSIGEKLLNRQQNINNLSSKELKIIQQKAKEDFISLRREKENLENKQRTTTLLPKEAEALKKVNNLLKINSGLEESFNAQLESAVKSQQSIEESLGLTGSILQGISSMPGLSLLSKYLNVDDAVDSMEEYSRKMIDNIKNSGEYKKQFGFINKNIQTQANHIENLQDKLKDITLTTRKRNAIENEISKRSAKLNEHLTKKVRLEEEATSAANSFVGKLTVGLVGVNSLLKGFAKGLSDPVVIIGAIVNGFSNLNKAQVEFTQQTGRDVAHFDTINGSLISSVDYIKQAVALTKQFGIQSDLVFTSKTIQEATEMVELMGMGSEEAGNMARWSKINSKELKSINKNIIEQVNNFNKVNKTGISQRAILEEVSKVSNSIAITFKGNPEKIAMAVSEAKKLGLSLEQVDKVAESLLNFESSIASELEAELLSGKDLNLERARYFALTNDLNALTKEIGNNQEVINSFANSNRIQQDAIAKSMGLSREEMAKMIYDQQITNGLSDEQLQKVMGITSEDFKRLTIQESINKSIEKMTQALAGPLELMASLASNSFILYTTLGLIATAQLPKLLSGFSALAKITKLIKIQEMGSAIFAGLRAAFSSPASLLTGGIAGLAAGAGITAFIMSQNKKADQVEDGIINPNGGPVVSKFTKGQLVPIAQGIKEDNVILTTNKPNNTNNGSNSNELLAIKEILMSIASNTGKIEIDGSQIGRILTPFINIENIKTSSQLGR